MAFRLKRDGSIAKGLSRLVDKEFRVSQRRLTEPEIGDEAVHEARTSVKKIRAILRLLKRELGPAYHASNSRLHKAADLLSGLRDVDATFETLQALRARYPAVLERSAVRTVGASLRARKRRARASAGRQLRIAIDELEGAARRTANRVRHSSSVSAVATGTVDGYRRARKAMGDLGVDSDDSSFHAWRRRVKDHWYHVRLFEGLHRNARARARRLSKLENLLGDEHNLVVLRATLIADEAHVADARTNALLLGCITKYQAWLRQRAVRLGYLIFSAPAVTIGKSVMAWCKGR